LAHGPEFDPYGLGRGRYVYLSGTFLDLACANYCNMPYYIEQDPKFRKKELILAAAKTNGVSRNRLISIPKL